MVRPRFVASSRSLFFVSLVAASAACSSSSDTTAGGTPVVLSDDEQSTFGTSSASLSSQQETATLADSMFDFDPTIDPTAAPDVNARAVGANTTTNLQGCGHVVVDGASVSVDFGAPPGCTLAGGAVISGQVGVAVSKTASTTSLALTLTDVVVNGKTVAGTTTFATSSGTTFLVTSSLAGATKSESANLTVVGGASSFTMSGTSTITEGGVVSAVAFKDVLHTKGQCYASSGTMTITKAQVAEVITFDASTPQTGQVTVQLGKRTSTTTLPPYGACPSAPTSTDAGREGGLGR